MRILPLGRIENYSIRCGANSASSGIDLAQPSVEVGATERPWRGDPSHPRRRRPTAVSAGTSYQRYYVMCSAAAAEKGGRLLWAEPPRGGVRDHRWRCGVERTTDGRPLDVTSRVDLLSRPTTVFYTVANDIQHQRERSRRPIRGLRAAGLRRRRAAATARRPGPGERPSLDPGGVAR
jgi:hypothetical protein